jgi:toxin ParE1/3/4
MAEYKLSNAAKIDLAEIYEFGIENFGLNQAQVYLTQLHRHFLILASNPELGREASEFSPGLRRSVFESHTIFYQPIKGGAYVVRILGQGMDYPKHL